MRAIRVLTAAAIAAAAFVGMVRADDYIRFQQPIPEGGGDVLEWRAEISFSDGSTDVPVEDITAWDAETFQGWVQNVHIRIYAIDDEGEESDLSNSIILPISKECRADLNGNVTVHLPDLISLHGILGSICEQNLNP